MSGANGKKRKGVITHWASLKHGERQQVIEKSGSSYFLARKILGQINPLDADTDADTIERVIEAYNTVISARKTPAVQIKEIA